MGWLIWALGAAFVWAIANLLDKVVLERYLSNPILYVVLDGFIGIFPIIGIIFFNKHNFGNLWIISAGFLTGILFSIFSYFYYRSLKSSDVSTVAIVVQTIPIFSTIWGFIFFDEKYTLMRYLGIAIIIFSTFLVSLQPKNKGSTLFTNKSMVPVSLLLLASFLMSVNYALQKMGLEYTNTFDFYMWGRLGSLTASIFVICFSNIRQDVTSVIKSLFMQSKKIGLSLILIQNLINLIGIYAILMAYQSGPISLVATAASIQPLFVIIVTLLINKIFKGSIPDKHTGTMLPFRLSSVFLIVLGAFLIFRR